MRVHQIEAWALKIIERVKLGQPIEDDRVELKREWIDPEKAARRIAGHANAARGEQILWLVGVDETQQMVIGVPPEELANWYEQVKTQFEGLAPQINTYNIPVDEQTVVALLFQTDRAPFVVKNAAYGKQTGVSAQYEVPWRENTKIRSATRSDLLQLLSPLQILPSFEVLEGSLNVYKAKQNSGYEWDLSVTLYAETIASERIVIPFHRCNIHIPQIFEGISCRYVILHPSRTVQHLAGGRLLSSPSSSLTIDSTDAEVLISGPGKLYLSANMNSSMAEKQFEDKPITVIITCKPINANREVTIEVNLVPSVISSKQEGRHWKVQTKA